MLNWSDSFEDSLLCGLSFASVSDQSRQCSDSDCSFHLCKMKRPNTKTVNVLSSPNKPCEKDISKHIDGTSAEQQDPNKYALAIIRIPSDYDPQGDDLAGSLQKIPQLMGMYGFNPNDMNLMVSVLRAGKPQIDAAFLDVSADGFASQFFWESSGTNLVNHYPEITFLSHQLGSRLKHNVDAWMRQTMQNTDRPSRNTVSIEEIPYLSRVISDNVGENNATKSSSTDEAFGIDRESIYKCRMTDPYMVTIQMAIYAEPQVQDEHFHKAAEEFALFNIMCSDNIFEGKCQPSDYVKDYANPTHPTHISQWDGINFQPTQSSTPTKLPCMSLTKNNTTNPSAYASSGNPYVPGYWDYNVNSYLHSQQNDYSLVSAPCVYYPLVRPMTALGQPYSQSSAATTPTTSLAYQRMIVPTKYRTNPLYDELCKLRSNALYLNTGATTNDALSRALQMAITQKDSKDVRKAAKSLDPWFNNQSSPADVNNNNINNGDRSEDGANHKNKNDEFPVN